MIVEAYNPETEDLEKTTLSTGFAAAVTSLTVKNNNSFANTNHILIGEMGQEKSELGTINSAVTAGTTLPVTATKFPHSVDDPIYLMKYDSIKFYRSTAGIGGPYTLLATVPIDVDNSELKTQYDDTAGIASYYYTISFYDSTNTYESEQSDPIPGAGANSMTAGAVIDQVMEEVGDPQGVTTPRNVYYSWLNEVNYALQKRMRKPYDFLKRDLVVNVTAGQGVAYPTDVLHFDTVEYRYTLSGYTRVYNPRPIYYDEWIALTSEPNFNIPNDEIEALYFDDVNAIVQTYPSFATSQTGTWIFHYWKKFTQIDSDGDTLETIDPQIYKMYLKGMFYRKKAAQEERFMAVSDRWLSDYNVELAQVSKYDRKNIGKPQNFRIQFRPNLRNYRGFRYR